MTKVILHQGLGDNIYSRPYVQELAKEELTVETPFPQLFKGVDFSEPQTRLLPTQSENVAKYSKSYTNKKSKKTLSLIYPGGLKEGLSIPKTLDKFITPEPYNFSLVPDKDWVDEARKILKIFNIEKPLCLVKFPTEREEFNIPSRNPKMKYFKLFIEKNDYFYIDITQTNENEWYSEDIPRMVKLRLDLNTLIGMASLADLILCPPSFMLPLGISLGTKTFSIFGGYVKPELLLDPRMDLTKFSYIAPEPFCNCILAEHKCNKEIDERRIPTLRTSR